MHPLSIIHSEDFEVAGVVPYSAVRGIGFTKRLVKQKHLMNQWVMKDYIQIRTDRESSMRFRNEVHNDAIRAFYLAPYKIFKVPGNSVRRFCFSAGDLSLQKRVKLS